MTSAPVVTAHELRIAFGPRVVLDGVSLSVGADERVGLVGNNGSGKSTLARILAGVDLADEGTVTRRRDATVAYLAQEPQLDPDARAIDVVTEGLAAWTTASALHDTLSARIAERGERAEPELLVAQAEAAAEVERLGGWNVAHRAEAVLAHLGVTEIEAPVGRLSGGEQRRVALARILMARPSLAILDEPTNHLDVDAIEWLERYFIEEHAGALLLVTHDRYVLERVVTRTVEIESGRVWSCDGGYEAYVVAKGERIAHEARSEANRQNFLRRELEWLRRGPKARTTKQKARIDRAEAVMAERGPDTDRDRAPALAMGSLRLGKSILDMRGLVLELSGKRLVDGLDLSLVAGERVGVVGANGTGKTTLLRAITGELVPTAGTLVRGANTRIAYFDQTRGGLDEDKSIFDNVAGTRLQVDLEGCSVDVRTYLERFLFDGATQRQLVSALSGGERARVALAKLLLEPANLVLLDEPTNDLDVATLGALEEMLVSFDGCVIVVSHDRWFLDRVATSILGFEGGGRVVHQPGDWDTYRTLREQRIADERARAREAVEPPPRRVAPSAHPPPGDAPARVKRLTYAERSELDGLLDAVGRAETRVRELEAQLADPALYTKGGGEPRRVAAALDAARAESARLVARWEELETRREATP